MRRLSGRRLSGIGGAAALLAVIGGGASWAGASGVPPFQTSMTATPAILSVLPPKADLFTLSATLTGPYGPITGALIYFTVPVDPSLGTDQVLCTGHTDAEGTATCKATSSALAIISNDGYSVYFGGNPNYEQSAASAPLIGL